MERQTQQTFDMEPADGNTAGMRSIRRTLCSPCVATPSQALATSRVGAEGVELDGRGLPRIGERPRHSPDHETKRERAVAKAIVCENLPPKEHPGSTPGHPILN